LKYKICRPIFWRISLFLSHFKSGLLRPSISVATHKFVFPQMFGSRSKGEVFVGVNFINILRAHFLYQRAFFAKTKLEKSCQKDFRMKNAHMKCWQNWRHFGIRRLARTFYKASVNSVQLKIILIYKKEIFL